MGPRWPYTLMELCYRRREYVIGPIGESKYGSLVNIIHDTPNFRLSKSLKLAQHCPTCQIFKESNIKALYFIIFILPCQHL